MEKKKKKTILIILLLIIFLLIIYFSYRIFLNYKDDNEIKQELKEIKNEVIIPKEEPKNIDESKEKEEISKLELDFNKLKSINNDTVAWIRVSGTDIDYPIVQSTDNSYYLNHSFYKDINMNGWIFENSNNNKDFNDENTVLFGHNTNSSTMFSELKGIYKGEYGNSIKISIYLENNNYTYKVFSIYLDSPNNTTSISEYTNSYTLKEMKDKSKINFNIDITENDRILTLSTCNNITDDRIIMHAKRIN